MRRLKKALRALVVPAFLEPHKQRLISVFSAVNAILENFFISLLLPMLPRFMRVLQINCVISLYQLVSVADFYLSEKRRIPVLLNFEKYDVVIQIK